MDNSNAIDTALVYLDKITVSGVNNVLALARSIEAVLQVKRNLDSGKETEKNGAD